MRPSLSARIASACALIPLLVLTFASCGSRTGDFDLFGSTDPASSCGKLGDTCSASETCCNDLLCKDGLCKPEQICAPQGSACATTVDCCNFDCANGFCGGVACKPT